MLNFKDKKHETIIAYHKDMMLTLEALRVQLNKMETKISFIQSDLDKVLRRKYQNRKGHIRTIKPELNKTNSAKIQVLN